MRAREESAPVDLNLRIEGMHCAGCARAVEHALTGVRGVKAVLVDLEAGRATVRKREETSPGDLVAAVERAGYPASLN